MLRYTFLPRIFASVFMLDLCDHAYPELTKQFFSCLKELGKEKHLENCQDLKAIINNTALTKLFYTLLEQHCKKRMLMKIILIVFMKRYI